MKTIQKEEATVTNLSELAEECRELARTQVGALYPGTFSARAGSMMKGNPKVRQTTAALRKKDRKSGELMVGKKKKLHQEQMSAVGLSEVAAECRELGTTMAGGGLMANERGEFPWQAHQRKKRRDNMVKGAVVGGAAGAAGYAVNKGVQAAGGYRAVGDVAKTAAGVARQAQGGMAAKGGVGAAVAGARGAAKAVMPGAKAAVKGVGSAAMEALKRLRK